MTTSTPLQIVSDLHLEVERSDSLPGQEFYHYDLPVCAPYLCLLGDIGYTVHDGLFVWLKQQVKRFNLVFYVSGNHEAWRSSISKSERRLEDFAKSHPNFIYLNRGSYDLTPSLTLLGCTLWTSIDPSELDILQSSWQDWRRIQGFSSNAQSAQHATDLAWLNDTVTEIVETEPHRRIVILTHHAPTRGGTSPPQFDQDSPIKSAFSTELTGQPCWNSDVVKLWAFGHTHWSCDFAREGIRVYANQRGYKHGDGRYDAGKIVNV